MNGTRATILPRSTAPPTDIAQTVAQKTIWKNLETIFDKHPHAIFAQSYENNIDGMVPTGLAPTPRWNKNSRLPITLLPLPNASE